MCYDGSTMKQVDAQDILDIAMAGTNATLLAKRWESALLVNVDNETLFGKPKNFLSAFSIAERRKNDDCSRAAIALRHNSKI